MLLTQCRHLFRKICPEAAKEVAAGQKVKGRVAAHGVESERVHGAGKLGHVSQLVLPVGGHREKLMLYFCFQSDSYSLQASLSKVQVSEVGCGRTAAIQTLSPPLAS